MTTSDVRDPAWPRQLRLQGQAAAPDGPVDVKMTYVTHRGIRRDLDGFGTAVEHTPLEDRGTWRALAARWRVFTRILHNHQDGEDLGLWPYVAERADAAGKSVLAVMADEHDEIDAALGACGDALARLAAVPDAEVRAVLAVRLHAAKEMVGRHLAHEERDAMAVAQRVMTQREWDEVSQAAFDDGLGLRDWAVLVPWLMTALPPSVQDQLKTGAPRALRVIWALTRRRFSRRDAYAFRYAR